MTYRLVPTTDDDRPWLDELRRAVYYNLFIATWGEWDEDRHARHFRECWARGGISVIEYNCERVGMIQLAEHDASIEVCEIQIHPSVQGRGIGTRVLQDTVARAHAEGNKVCLSTGLKNAGALRLYRRLGFAEVNKTRTHFHMESVPNCSG